MRGYLTPLVRHFDTRSLRERVLLTLALAVLCYFVVDVALIQPATAHQMRLRDELAHATGEEAQMQVEIARLHSQLAALSAPRADLPVSPSRDDDPLPDGEAIAGLLRRFAQGGPGVSLESLRASAPRHVHMEEGKGAGEPVGKDAVLLEPVFQHSIEFVLSGSYLDILTYLQQVEALPILLYWGDVRLAVTAHPRTTLAAVVHVFSHAAAVDFQ